MHVIWQARPRARASARSHAALELKNDRSSQSFSRALGTVRRRRRQGRACPAATRHLPYRHRLRCRRHLGLAVAVTQPGTRPQTGRHRRRQHHLPGARGRQAVASRWPRRCDSGHRTQGWRRTGTAKRLGRRFYARRLWRSDSSRRRPGDRRHDHALGCDGDDHFDRPGHLGGRGPGAGTAHRRESAICRNGWVDPCRLRRRAEARHRIQCQGRPGRLARGVRRPVALRHHAARHLRYFRARRRRLSVGAE